MKQILTLIAASALLAAGAHAADPTAMRIAGNFKLLQTQAPEAMGERVVRGLYRIFNDEC